MDSRLGVLLHRPNTCLKPTRREDFSWANNHRTKVIRRVNVSVTQVRSRRIAPTLIDVYRHVLCTDGKINLMYLGVSERVNMRFNITRNCYLTKATRHGMKRTIPLNGSFRSLGRVNTNRYISLGVTQFTTNRNFRLTVLNFSLLSHLIRRRGIATFFNNLSMNTTKFRLSFQHARAKSTDKIDR